VGTTATRSDLGVRARTLLLVLGAIALATLLGPPGLVALLLLGGGVALVELGELQGVSRPVSLALSLVVVSAAGVWAATGLLPAWVAGASMVVGLAAVLVLPARLLRGPGLLLVVGGGVVLPALVVALQLSVRAPLWLAATFALLQVHDITAYLVGRRFGRIHPLPRLSPGKSVAGFVGGGAAIVLAAAWARAVFGVPVWGLDTAILALVLVAVAAGGDLALSAVKRRVGASDFGTTLPGHGGILDRFDNTVIGLPLFAWLIDAGLLL